MRHIQALFGDRLAPDGSLVADNFAAWFRGSKVVDAVGAPLMVFHGTANAQWSNSRRAFGRTNGMGEGAYFTPIAGCAAELAQMDSEVDGDAQFLIPVFLAIQRPILMTGIDSQSISPSQKEALFAQGYDGVFGVYGPDQRINEIVVFEPRQIKSAVGNSGLFDHESEDVSDAHAWDSEVQRARQRICP